MSEQLNNNQNNADNTNPTGWEALSDMASAGKNEANSDSLDRQRGQSVSGKLQTQLGAMSPEERKNFANEMRKTMLDAIEKYRANHAVDTEHDWDGDGIREADRDNNEVKEADPANAEAQNDTTTEELQATPEWIARWLQGILDETDKPS
jgi:hypothetical protein